MVGGRVASGGIVGIDAMGGMAVCGGGGGMRRDRHERRATVINRYRLDIYSGRSRTLYSSFHRSLPSRLWHETSNCPTSVTRECK